MKEQLFTIPVGDAFRTDCECPVCKLYEDLEKEYTLKFLKLPLEDDLNDYIRSGTNYLDYDEVVSSDSKWDGDLDHKEVLKNILKEEFNFSRTKYISIDTIYEIAKMSAQQSYFFNMLFELL